MKLLKKRTVAWTCVVILALLSVLGLGGVKLLSQRKAATDAFYQGENGSSAYKDLQSRKETSYHLLYITQQVLPPETRELVLCQDIWEEYGDAKTPEEFHRSNGNLQTAVENLYARLLRARGLTQELRDIASQHYYDFIQRMNNLQYDDYYNNMADEYNKMCEAFPGNLIAAVTGKGSLPTFRKDARL